MPFNEDNSGSFSLFRINFASRTTLIISLIMFFAAFGSSIYYLFHIKLPMGSTLLLLLLFLGTCVTSSYAVHIAFKRYLFKMHFGVYRKEDKFLAQRFGLSLTKEQQYIEQLRISNQELQLANEIIEKSSIIIFDWSLAPGIPVKYVSNNIRYLGYEPEEFYTGKVDYWDIVYPDDLQKTQNTVWQTRNSQATNNSHRYRVVSKNSGVRWVEEWAFLERDSEGNLISEKGVIRDITNQLESEDKIRRLSSYDRLTGIYNRSYFEQALQELDDQGHYPLSIVFADINGLKLTNDTLGYKFGDSMVQAAAKILQRVCRINDVVARVGGNEFALVLPNTNGADASKLCKEIHAQSRLFCNEHSKLSMALGYSTKTDIKTCIDEVLNEADDNMYKNKLNESSSIRSGIIYSLKATLEEKTMETKEHAERLKEISLSMAKELDFVDSALDELAIASIMHDIGKIGIPDSILLKPGKLTEEEWTTMKKHPEIGYHIFLSSPKLTSIAEYILAHHERWDGKGYPKGLKGEAIPLIARIISIADSYDVMTHNRPYSQAMTTEQAAEELKRCAGSQFDPYLVDVFCRIYL